MNERYCFCKITADTVLGQELSTYGIAPDPTDQKRKNGELSPQVLCIRKEIANFVKKLHTCQFKIMGLINTSQAALSKINKLYLSEMRSEEKSEDTFIFKAVGRKCSYPEGDSSDCHPD